MKDHIKYLRKMNACHEAVSFASDFGSLQEAWNACQRGDWMLWLLGRTLDLNDETQLRQLTLAKAQCAKLVLHLMKDERSKKAVSVAEQFGLGNTTRDELNAAAAAAYADVAYAYAAYAAYAAVYAAAAYAVYAAATYAAYAAADAAADDDAAAAQRDILAQAANIVRSIFPSVPEARE